MLEHSEKHLEELVLSVTDGNLEEVTKVVDSWPELLNKQEAHRFATVYWTAWKADDEVICNYLICKKYNQEESSIRTSTKLGRLVRSGDSQNLKAKLNERNCNWRDLKGRTPLMWSAIGNKTFSKDDVECLDLLLECKSDIAATDLDENTPLHFAAAADNLAVLRRLIKAGASLDVKNLRGLTPIQETEGMRCQRVIRLLRNEEIDSMDEHASDGRIDDVIQQQSSSDEWEAFSSTSSISSSNKSALPYDQVDGDHTGIEPGKTSIRQKVINLPYCPLDIEPLEQTTDERLDILREEISVIREVTQMESKSNEVELRLTRITAPDLEAMLQALKDLKPEDIKITNS